MRQTRTKGISAWPVDDRPLTAVDEAWISVAEQRLDDLLTGRVTGVSASRVFDRIRRDHEWNR